MEALTAAEIDALRQAIPARTGALTKLVANEQDPEMKAAIRAERDALESALVKLAAMEGA